MGYTTVVAGHIENWPAAWLARIKETMRRIKKPVWRGERGMWGVGSLFQTDVNIAGAGAKSSGRKTKSSWRQRPRSAPRKYRERGGVSARSFTLKIEDFNRTRFHVQQGRYGIKR